ncbi:hypothetical protein VARIO8X_160094 [Burkholderiales bacterium 8X]|nr:hypothetical protein VARIO8X_160094 [Burkholderiales bacterium 8X]
MSVFLFESLDAGRLRRVAPAFPACRASQAGPRRTVDKDMADAADRPVPDTVLLGDLGSQPRRACRERGLPANRSCDDSRNGYAQGLSINSRSTETMQGSMKKMPAAKA